MRAALCMLLVIFLAVPAGAWQQMQGDAQRSGVLDWPGGPLDVVASVQVHDTPHGTARFPGQSYLETPHGITTVLRNGTDCLLGHFRDLAAGDVAWTPLTGCPGATLQAYDPVQDLLVLCTTGDAETASVQLRSAGDGALRFQVPLAPLPGAPSDPTGMLPEPTGDVIWTCNGAALDTGSEDPLLVVPAVASRSLNDVVDHQIIGIIPSNGQVDWTNRVDVGATLGEPGQLADGTVNARAPFLPMTATVTDSGVVVSGRYLGEQDDPLVAWFDRGGNYQGAYRGTGPDDERSYFAAGAGSAALARVGDKVLLIEASDEVPARVVDLPAYDPGGSGFQAGIPGPVWHQGSIYLPSRSGIVALHEQDLALQWSWRGVGPDWQLWNVAATGGGELVAVAYYLGPNPDSDSDPGPDVWHHDVMLLRLDAFTGGVLQAVPLTLTSRDYRDPAFSACDPRYGCFVWELPFELVVSRDRLLLLSADGDATVLAPAAEEGPPLTRYPRIGERVDVEVPVGEDVASVTVAWGDGSTEVRRPESSTGLFRQEERAGSLLFSHAFRDDVLVRGSITTLHADKTTKTTAMQFDVGGTPPRDLNFIQRQFEAENQDRTWGVIGVALAVLGGLYGYWFRTRRHRRIRQELEALNKIHARSLEDPEGALQDLDAQRRYLNGQLMSGKMDDGQYQLVMERAAGISRRLHRRLLGDLADRLSPGFYELMEATLSDAFMNRDEAKHLQERLGQETGLRKKDLDRVASFIDAWATGAPSPPE